MSIAPFHTQFAHTIYTERYRHPDDGDWAGTAWRVTDAVLDALPGTRPHGTAAALVDHKHRLHDLIAARRFIPGGRYLYAAGREYHQVNNCLLLRVDDSREGWAELSYRAEMALMSGAGIGVWYGDLRPGGAPIRKTGGVAGGPLGKMRMTNEMGREIIGGGNRRAAIWAGLPWWHQDVFDFIKVKDWPEEVRALKAKAAEEGTNFSAPMDTTNISVTLDDDFFYAYHGQYEEIRDEALAPDGSHWHEWAHMVYDTAVEHMLRHGEPGFTVDLGDKAGEVLRNACTEITSADDSDVCNLGSLVLPRFSTPEQFGAAVRDAVLFLTAGTCYSDVPYAKVAEIRNKNRRLGLGIIGLHEFLIRRGVGYGTPEAFEVLEPYMREYARALEYAHEWQDSLGLSLSKGATAIAPNGTIGIVAESTPSADPIFSAAEQRRVKTADPVNGDAFESHIVVDPVAKRLVAEGHDPELIEDAHALSLHPERRLAMTAYLQRYTDHAISGTVNLPGPITTSYHVAQFGDVLMKYLPNLRGITVYPDGARAGQPRTPVELAWAVENEGVILETAAESCSTGACGV